ncbi:hypothetical protein AWB67_01230 [Caballeronia terrestris]|jgi:hypothetical protein|uniref:DUF6484 domain-containing protein n=1 Tax=Caballeronia terrestris TaxID=1226301 RepID=A0A158GCD7_9BURK|nr:DUF6484 domain-containing protein [Caballeronia terrestris]SAL29050.1 hypothetical protein AWB67_01230 [Caballeronia terrestris]
MQGPSDACTEAAEEPAGRNSAMPGAVSATEATGATGELPANSIRWTTPVVALFVGFGPDGWPLVGITRTNGVEVVRARSTVPLAARPGGSHVVVCEDPAGAHPVIVGVVDCTGLLPGSEWPAGRPSAPLVGRCAIAASDEVVLSCGKASITLTKAGRIVIQGAYVLSRSTGAIKIKGALVDIN